MNEQPELNKNEAAGSAAEMPNVEPAQASPASAPSDVPSQGSDASADSTLPSAPQWEAAASKYLTREGVEWIGTSLNVPLPPKFQVPFNDLAEAFGCRPMEAFLLHLQIISALLGPAWLIEDQLDRLFPLSLQVVTLSSPTSGYAVGLECVRRMVVDSYRAEFGRTTLHTDYMEGDNRRLDGEQERTIDIVRKNRKAAMFPYGDDISPKLVNTLKEASAECFYTAFGTHASLERYLSLPGELQAFVDSFVNPGWSGESCYARDNHILYPTVNIAWTAPLGSDFSAVRLLSRLNGLLIAEVKPQTNPQPPVIGDVVKRYRVESERLIAVWRRGSSIRHMDPRTIPRKSLNQVGEEIAKAGDLGRFAIPGGGAEGLMAAAPIQISKIAALLVYRDANEEIGVTEFKLATSIYRWLLRSTLVALASVNVPKLTAEDDITLQKLRTHGSLSFRELSRKIHRADSVQLGVSLNRLMEAGLIVKLADGRFHVIGRQS